MRYTDKIDVVFTTEDVTEINAALTTLETKFSVLRALSKLEVRRMSHFGLRNETFSLEAIAAAQQNAQLIPPGIDLAAVERDRVARELLAPMAQRVQKLNEKLMHSRRMLGADMYGAARAIYKALQEFGAEAGIGELLAGLALRFAGQGAKKTTTPTGETIVQG